MRFNPMPMPAPVVRAAATAMSDVRQPLSAGAEAGAPPKPLEFERQDPVTGEVVAVTFKRVLLNKCQEEFEKGDAGIRAAMEDAPEPAPARAADEPREEGECEWLHGRASGGRRRRAAAPEGQSIRVTTSGASREQPGLVVVVITVGTKDRRRVRTRRRRLPGQQRRLQLVEVCANVPDCRVGKLHVYP
jgi:hypothetical protein